MNNISVEEAVKEFEDNFFGFKKDVSKNHGDAYDPEILSSDLFAYQKFTETEMFTEILAL